MYDLTIAIPTYRRLPQLRENLPVLLAAASEEHLAGRVQVCVSGQRFQRWNVGVSSGTAKCLSIAQAFPADGECPFCPQLLERGADERWKISLCFGG